MEVKFTRSPIDYSLTFARGDSVQVIIDFHKALGIHWDSVDGDNVYVSYSSLVKLKRVLWHSTIVISSKVSLVSPITLRR